jgi:hypothetical protein
MRIKTLSAIAAVATISTITMNAQQLTNASFETWEDCTPWNSKYTTTTQGTTPTGWCVSNIVTPGMSLGNASVASKEAGNDSDSAVRVYNRSTAGQVIPGYVTLGTSWATARVKGTAPVSGTTDGGSWGNISFSFLPDAVAFDYLHTQGTGSTQPATAVAYLWKGETSQADVPANNTYGLFSAPEATTVTMIDRDRNVLGIDATLGGEITKSDDFELIAAINTGITDVNSEWKRMTIPFEYYSDATPTKANIIFAAGDYFADRSALKTDDALTIDNVSFIYYSRLTSLAVDGVAIEGFDADTYQYTVNAPLTEETAISTEKMGRSARSVVSADYDTATVTITVSNVSEDIDGESSHTYTLHFNTAEDDNEGDENSTITTVSSATYKGTISISLGGDPEVLENQAVEITSTGEGLCTFALNHFSLDVSTDMGNIVVENVKTTADAAGNITYTGAAEGITLSASEDFTIYANVEIEGTEDNSHNLTMLIHVLWLINGPEDTENVAPIEVTFNGKMAGTTGVANIATDTTAPARYFHLNGVEVSNPTTPGIYIVLRGNHASKMVIK